MNRIEMNVEARIIEDEEAILNLVFIMEKEDGAIPSAPSTPPPPPPPPRPAVPQPAPATPPAADQEMTNQEIIAWLEGMLEENRKLRAEVEKLERRLQRQVAMTRTRTSVRVRRPRHCPYC